MLNFSLFLAFLDCRDVDLTEKLDYSSAVVLVGYSLILAILRSLSIKDEATRVMVAAPLIAFVATHVMYINFYTLDYGMSYDVIFILLILRPRDECRAHVFYIKIISSVAFAAVMKLLTAVLINQFSSYCFFRLKCVLYEFNVVEVRLSFQKWIDWILFE